MDIYGWKEGVVGVVEIIGCREFESLRFERVRGREEKRRRGRSRDLRFLELVSSIIFIN